MKESRAALVGRVLEPARVAVIGASEDLGKFGARVFNNAVNGGFPGALFPINPKRDSVMGLRAWPRVSALPDAVDLAVIAVPRPSVLNAVKDCAQAGVGAVLIITSGFGESGNEGAALQTEIVEIARGAGMGVIGPNCLGLLNTHAKLILNSSPAMVVTAHPPGGIAFISQSGALLATLYNRGVDDGAAFSVAVSIGNQADLTLADFVDYLASHSPTRVVTLYVEGFRDAAAFMSAAKRCRDAGKPVLLLKAGRTDEGARVAFSHTASLATDQRVLEAACREAGVLLVRDINGMIQAAEFFSRFGPPRGDGIGVISPSGGAATVVTDRMQDRGLRLAQFSSGTRRALESIYAPAQLGNPLDLGWLTDPSHAHGTDGGAPIVAADPDVCALLFPITTSPRLLGSSVALAKAAVDAKRPFGFVMLPGSAADEARKALRDLRAPLYETIDDALGVLATWTDWLATWPAPQRDLASTAPCNIEWPKGRLGEHATKQLLTDFGVTVTREMLVRTADDARRAARELGFPVAVKGVAANLVHKSDAGVVHLDLADECKMDAAWAALHRQGAPRLDAVLVAEMIEGDAELLVGVRRDGQFGPVMSVGWGGIMVELLDDVFVCALPVDKARGRALLERLKVWPVLQGLRGRPTLDIDAVLSAMTSLSALALAAGERLEEIEVNPLIVRCAGKGAVAVDARARFKD